MEASSAHVPASTPSGSPGFACPRCHGRSIEPLRDGTLRCVSSVLVDRETRDPAHLLAAGRALDVGSCGMVFTRGAGIAAAYADVDRGAEAFGPDERSDVDELAGALRELEGEAERAVRAVGAFIPVVQERMTRPWGVEACRVHRGGDWDAVERAAPGAFLYLGLEPVLRNPQLDADVARWFARVATVRGVRTTSVAWPVARRTLFGRPAVVDWDVLEERPGQRVPAWVVPDGSTLGLRGRPSGPVLVGFDGALHTGPGRLRADGRGGQRVVREGRLNPVALATMASLLGFPEALDLP